MVRIQVTQAHIDKGNRFNTNCCPVALALQDVFGKECSVYYLIHLPDGQHIPTPSNVLRHIIQYDKSTEMIPFDFEINQPRKVFDESW